MKAYMFETFLNVQADHNRGFSHPPLPTNILVSRQEMHNSLCKLLVHVGSIRCLS